MDVPISRIMRFLQGVTHAGMASGEDPLPLPLQARRVKLEIHQLVHILQDQHVAIQLHDAVILCEAEGRQFGPAVVEARVRRIILPLLRQEVFRALLGNAAGFKNSMPLGREGICVECHEGIFRVVLLEAVVQREETREILCVGNKGRPDCCNVRILQLCIITRYAYPFVTLLPFEPEPYRWVFRLGLGANIGDREIPVPFNRTQCSC